MEGIKLIPSIILLVAISGIIAGAGAIVMGKFGDSMSTKCYNASFSLNTTTYGKCDNNTLLSVGADGCCGRDKLNLSDQYYIKHKTQEGIGDVAEQVPTVAIISVMVIIISIIAGVFAYMRMFG